MELRICDKCKKEIKHSLIELHSEKKEEEYGMWLTTMTREFCSLKCLANWIDKSRRGVVKTTTITNNGSIITFWNPEFKKNFGSWEVQEENGIWYLKLEIWNELIEI